METPGYHDQKDALRRRLRRIEGQVRGIHRMVEEDSYCIDIVTQVAAVKSALAAVSVELVGAHLTHCVSDAIANAGAEPELAAARVAEATHAISRLVRS